MAENSIVNNIYQQFIDYFGEENVDIQGYRDIRIDSYAACNYDSSDKVILVHWKDVTVTNEYDDSVDIWDLYSATIIATNGKLRNNPLFNRSTYDNIQWLSDYAHSHLSGINKSDIRKFRTSCLGSGPINATIRKLEGDQYEDMDIWGLYCWELDKYVHVESITGVPYRRIKNIGTDASSGERPLRDFPIQCSLPFGNADRFVKGATAEIIKMLIKEDVLKYSFYNGHYTLATPFVDTVLLMSNSFIEWYNTHPDIRKLYPKERLYSLNIMCKMYLRNNIFYSKNSSNTPIEAIVGTEMFTFKGEPVKLSLINFHQEYDAGEVHIINIDLLGYMVYTILKYINMKYGKSKDNTAEKARII